MSAIYFHSPSHQSSVSGTERHYAAYVVNEMFLISLGVRSIDSPTNPHPLRSIIAPTHYCLQETGKQFEDALITAASVDGFGPLFLDPETKEPIDTFCAALNSALVMGSDAVKFQARLHGQCELHGYVEGQNRDWLADIIFHGTETGILRFGWTDVITHLRQRDDEPIVMSYSVCDSFPDAGVAYNAKVWTPPKYEDSEEDDWDTWYDLSESEQWELGLKAIRQEHGLEMKPDNWNDFYFGDGLTGFDILDTAINLSKERDNANQ